MTGKRQSNSFMLQAKARDGVTPVIYSLRCSATEVYFEEDDEGIVACTPSVYTLQVLRTIGSQNEVLSAAPAGYNVMFKEGDDGEWTDGQPLGTLDAGSELLDGGISLITYGLFKGSQLLQEVKVLAKWKVPGEKGDATPSYEIRSTVDAVTIASGDASATLTCSVGFWEKEGKNAATAYECYWALFRRKGTTYRRINYGTSKVPTTQFSNISTLYNDITWDAFVVFISDSMLSANSVPESYLAKKEISINKHGNPGDTGPGGEVYSIMSGLGSITIGSNTTSGTFTATVSFYKKVGNAARTAYACFCSVFRKKGSTYTYLGNNGSSKASNWYAEGLPVVASTCDALVFCIYDSMSSSHSGYLAELEIPVYKHGDTGPSYWPSGSYDPLVTYRKIGNRTPLVFMEDESMTVWNEYAQAYGDYWYLTADTNVVNGTHYKPQDGSSYWAKAENYGVLMVGAQFARFAKNGAGVMAGDYFYSANGRIDGVERVDGQGADGNAVSASNPPAYTRFMGDPTTQNGYLNRVDLQGPVNGDRAQLATVYVQRGVTLNVKIKGKTYYDGTSSKYGYFCIYNGSVAMTSWVYIYRIQREVKLHFTPSETGEYTIEYYGMDTATKATFFLRWELSGHFYPNWWVDLKTGKMHGAKDNFIIDGDSNVKVNGAMMTHKVKLQTKYSKWVTYPDHAAYESDYWNADGDVYLYEPESDGLPVRVYADPDAIYYGLRSCRLKFDQVYVGVEGAAGRRVVIYLPPPHLFIGQRIAITNNSIDFPTGSDLAGVFLQMDYMFYTRTDYTEGICLTGQEAYFEDDGTGEQDGNGKNGKPYIVGVPERDGAGPIPACGIWIGENIQAINGVFFISNLIDEMNIEAYEWMELTAVRGYLAEKYEGTSYWEDTMNYNAYWMLTRWEKKK